MRRRRRALLAEALLAEALLAEALLAEALLAEGPASRSYWTCFVATARPNRARPV
jgi:hypothetical protein